MRNGIRTQLFFGFGALVLVICLFFTRLTFLIVEVTEEVVANYLLETQLQQLEKSKLTQKLTEQLLMPAGFRLVAKAKLGNQEPLEPAITQGGLYRLNDNGIKGFVKSIESHPDKHWLVLNPTQAIKLGSLTDVYTVFLGSITAGAMLLSLLSTWFIANRLSAPLRNLAESVTQQEPEQPCKIPARYRGDEIGQLSMAFHQAYVDVQEVWRRERDFASDVSHELRTPIALIRNTLALTEDKPLSKAERLLLMQSTEAMQNTVEVLLALARKENLIFQPVSLRPAIERSVMDIIQLHSDAQFEVALKLDNQYTVVGNQNLIRLLCQNLINNGFYHGGGKGMYIEQQNNQIVLCNPIISGDRDSNYQGLGHGQYLVQRITSVMGWRIEFSHSATEYRVLLTPVMAC